MSSGSATVWSQVFQVPQSPGAGPVRPDPWPIPCCSGRPGCLSCIVWGVLSPVSLGRDRACPVFFHASFWPSGVEVLRAQGNGHTFSALSEPIRSCGSTGYCKVHPYSVSGECAACSAFLNGAFYAALIPIIQSRTRDTPRSHRAFGRSFHCTRLPKRNRGVLLPSGLSSAGPGILEKKSRLVLNTTESIYNPSRDLHAATETDEHPSLAI